MKSTRMAIFVAVACGVPASLAHAQAQSRPFTPSAYEYGNYDYYNTAAQPTPAPAPGAPAAAPAPSCNAAAPGCNAAAPTCAAAPSCGCDSCNSCGCNDCCHKKLGHCCCWNPKLKPCFCWDECCKLDCPAVETHHCFDDCCWLKEKQTTLTGWASGGIMGNSDDPASHFNGPVTFADRDDGQFNQLYGVLERTTDITKNCGWFVGGRIDYMWGSDYFFTTSAGLDGTPNGNTPRWNSTDSFLYGSAMPQLYVETDYDDLRIKWGHFYTIIGYEVVPDIGNFFYTHAYTMQYGEPFTHTGVLASRQWSENWTWYAGVVSGWDTFDADARANFIGGVSYTDAAYGGLAFSIITGDNSVSGLPGTAPFDNRTMYSLVWSRTLTSRWSYVLQHDLGVQQNANNTGDNAEWYGLNQYLFYKINCCWTAGVRFEWFRDDDGYRVAGLRTGNPIGGGFAGDFYETSLGLNYKPNGNWAIRPELRYDWYNGTNGTNGGQPYDDGAKSNQFLFGLDAIYQF